MATTQEHPAPRTRQDGAASAERLRTNEGVLAIFRTADAARRYFGRLFEPYGLTTQQYNVLRILRGALPHTLPTMEIAARMMEQTPGITRLLDRLDEKGLIIRHRCVEDRRQMLCTISPAGLALLEELAAAVDEADDTVLAPLSPADVDRLIQLLALVRQGIE